MAKTVVPALPPELDLDLQTLQLFADAMPLKAWMADAHGRACYFNQQWYDYTSLTFEEAKNNGWQQTLHAEDAPAYLHTRQGALVAGEPFQQEMRLRGKDGTYRWHISCGIPQRNAEGMIRLWVGTCRDIDDQKQAREALEASERNFRMLAETVPQLVWVSSPDGAGGYHNQRYYAYTQASAEQALEQGWLQCIHPDDHERVIAVRRASRETGEPYEIEERLKDGRTGDYRWFLARAMPMRDETGQVVKWFGTCTDIEEQKRAEQQLKESRESLRVLAETVPQLVWIAQANGHLEYVNQRCCDYNHSMREQLLGDGWSQFLHPDDAERALAVREHAFRTGVPFESEHRLRNAQTGAYRWFLARAMPVRDTTGQIIKWFGTCTDIDEQKRTEEALRQSQERANILMNSNIIGITINEGEQIVDANDTFLRMTGYTREDLHEGRMNVTHMTPPKYLARIRQARQELATQQLVTPYEKEYICKDGSRLPVIVGRVVLQHHPSQGIGFALDNSARKELEQRKDAFISMASHELRNPLTVLKLQTSLLHMQLARQGTLDEAPALSSMETQIDKITRLVEELLDVSKIQAGRLEYIWETVDLDVLLQAITETMQQTHPSHRVLVRGTVGTSLIGDQDRLGQVFINLLSNAIKYSPDSEIVEMDLSTSGDVVTVRVRDHGLGIPREQCDKIFERFYRVIDLRQGAISGLGMGLYIVAEIVKGHGGTITVDSEVGKGSTFTVTFPKKREA